MDLDKGLALSVVTGGLKALNIVADKGITVDHLVGDGRLAFEFILAHRKEYSAVPSADLIFAKTGIDLPQTEDQPVEFWVNEVINRRVYHSLKDGSNRVRDHLEKRDPKTAAEVWDEVHRKILKEATSLSKVESIFALAKKVADYYEDMKAGKRGIPTPWATMNDQTLGWWPEDLVLFAARLAVGKTWTLIVLTHTAWTNGSKVLVASTEMNKVKMALRFCALHFRLPYEDFRKGKLGEFAEQAFYKGMKEILTAQGIDIVGGDFDFSIQNIEAALEESRPDLLAIDGAYLLKNIGKDRHERVSNTFDDLKRLAKRHKISVIANTQLNRGAKKGESSTISAENIGITDVAGWNSDVIYGLHQSDEMRRDQKMEIIAMKVREGKPQNFKINWDLYRMKFSEDENGTSGEDPPTTPPPQGQPPPPTAQTPARSGHPLKEFAGTEDIF